MFAILVVSMTATVPTMAVMHENVHQRAGQQQQERQRTEEVGTVLAQQEVRGTGAEDDQADGIARTPEGLGFGVMPGRVVIQFISPEIER